jgi:hypothetical protein
VKWVEQVKEWHDVFLCVGGAAAALAGLEFVGLSIRRADHGNGWIAHTVTPSPLTPLGIKGIGESGTIGSTPAIANAVMDALSPLGIVHIDIPLTAARVWQAIQDAGSNGLRDTMPDTELTVEG